MTEILYGQIAQSVEQRTENPRVGGSIPSLTTSNPLEKSGGFLFYPKTTYYPILGDIMHSSGIQTGYTF